MRRLLRTNRFCNPQRKRVKYVYYLFESKRFGFTDFNVTICVHMFQAVIKFIPCLT